MSIVVCAASRDTVWIMSDGLVLDENGKKVSGCYQKFKMISPSLCIGFTGSREFAETVCTNIFNWSKKVDISTVEILADYVIQITRFLHTKTDKTAQFVIAGISNNGCARIITIQSGRIDQILDADGDSIVTATLGENTIEGLDLSNYIRPVGNTIGERIRRAMNSLIVDVSQVDKSVNRNVFFSEFKISKPLSIPENA